MKRIILFIAITVVLLGAMFFIFSGNDRRFIGPPVKIPTPTPTPTPVSTIQGTTPTATTITSTVTVTYSDSGYSPAAVNVKKGDTVIFKNTGSNMMWTASAVHPTHKVYPGSGIEMCGTNTLVAIFDACKGYAQGESWEFKFGNQGTWKYHNHLQPNHFGTVIVE